MCDFGVGRAEHTEITLGQVEECEELQIPRTHFSNEQNQTGKKSRNGQMFDGCKAYLFAGKALALTLEDMLLSG